MKKKAIPPFTLTAGQSGRLLFNFTLPEGADMPALRGALMVQGQRVDMEHTQADMLTIPSLPAGVYLAEVRAAGMCVLYGHVEVLPSPLFGEEGIATYRVDVDNTAEVLQVNIAMLEGLPGPQGDTGAPGSTAYELAVKHGYEGSEEDWVGELKGAQEAANSSKQYAGEASSSATRANESADAAANSAKAAAAAQVACVSVGEQVKFDLFPLILDWLRERLGVLLGEGNFSVLHEENKLTVAVALATTAGQIDEVQQLLGRVVPQNIVTEMEWEDGLPMSYTRLEYLEGNPNTQINIPYATNADTGLAAEYMPLGNKISKSVLSASESIASMNVPYPSTSYQSWIFKFGIYDYSVATNYTGLEYVTGSVNYLNSKSGVTVLDGKEETTYRPNASFDGFANNLQVLKDFYRLRWAKVSQGDTVVKHLIPALDPEQRPCLYDLMSKQAYYNSGSGMLSCNGSEEYTPIDYIETTGGQYTRAAIVPSDYIGCRTSFSVSQQMNYPIICACEGTNYAYYLFAAANVEPGYSYIRWGSDNSANTSVWYNIGEEAVQELNWLNSKVVIGNGVQIRSLRSDTSFSLRQDLYLFASCTPGTVSPVPGGARLYSVEFSENATVVRHFVPALDSTGAPCFIETLSGVPFYNLGTGDFLYPGQETEATTYSLRRPQTFAQVTANGIRRLYHVPAGYNGTNEEYAAEHGYKVLVETPQPEEGYWVPEWRETEEEIVLEWVEAAAPEEEEL